MLDKLLKAKHWQIFSLQFGFILLYHLFLNDDDESMCYSFLTIYLFLVFYLWLWAVSVRLNFIINRKKNYKFFRFFWYTSLLIIFFVYLVLGIYMIVNNINYPEYPLFISDYILLFTIIQLFSIFGLIYCLFFTAKTLSTITIHHRYGVMGIIKELVLIIIFPIGIWLLQPQINLLANTEQRDK